MELFPAADEEQFNFIKKVIDDCDYYVLVVGGRYGTISNTGLSYTEMEYNYAKSRGVQILSFLHRNPENLTVLKSEKHEGGRRLLEEFRKTVSSGRLVDYWENGDDLASKVLLSLLQTMKAHPAVGWVRGNKVSNEGLLIDLNELRKENEELRSRIEHLNSKTLEEKNDIADFSDVFKLDIFFESEGVFGARAKYRQTIPLTWKEIFGAVATDLEFGLSRENVSEKIARSALKKALTDTSFVTEAYLFNTDELNTVIIQFRALGLIDFTGAEWKLSQRGCQMMLSQLAVKKMPNPT
jgi:hypothetical protein